MIPFGVSVTRPKDDTPPGCSSIGTLAFFFCNTLQMQAVRRSLVSVYTYLQRGVLVCVMRLSSEGVGLRACLQVLSGISSSGLP